MTSVATECSCCGGRLSYGAAATCRRCYLAACKLTWGPSEGSYTTWMHSIPDVRAVQSKPYIGGYPWRCASGIETEGQDGETRLGAKHESATPKGDAQEQPLEPKD